MEIVLLEYLDTVPILDKERVGFRSVLAHAARLAAWTMLLFFLPPFTAMAQNHKTDTLSVSIKFRQGRSNLDLGFMGNKETLDEFVSAYNSYPHKASKIHVIGYASPEGSVAINQRLSFQRAAVIAHYLQHSCSVVIDSIVSKPIGVNWQDLYAAVLADPKVPGREKALDIITNIPDIATDSRGVQISRRNRLLKMLENGRTWSYMFKHIFPHLRGAKAEVLCIVYLPEPEVPAPDEPEVAVEEPDEPEAAVEVATDSSSQSVGLPELADSPLKRRHVLSVGTNLLYDVFYMPNFGWAPMWNAELEYYPKKGNWTFLMAFTSPYYHRWAKNKFFQIRDYHIEARRYFRPGDFHTGAFLAGYVNATKYGVGLTKTKGWQGEGVGAALKVGYVWQLCRSGRWRLEACAAFGGFLTRFDPYVYGNPVTGEEDGDYYYDYTGSANSFNKRNHQRVWLGPTEFGIKLRYDVFYRRICKRGLSFKGKEVAK